jgi:hypothetical protein
MDTDLTFVVLRSDTHVAAWKSFDKLWTGEVSTWDLVLFIRVGHDCHGVVVILVKDNLFLSFLYSEAFLTLHLVRVEG